jgi:hypothetical protein
MDVNRFGKFSGPGHAITGDRTRRSRRVGWEYVHSIVDDCSRLAYSEIHDDEQAVTVTAFTRRAFDWFLAHGIVTERLMTDNAFAYVQSRSLRELLADRQILHLRTPPLHAPHERQGRALPADPPTRMGLRTRIRLEHRPPRVTATLGPPLQRAPHPLSARQPTPDRSRSGRPRARHLAAPPPGASRRRSSREGGRDIPHGARVVPGANADYALSMFCASQLPGPDPSAR